MSKMLCITLVRSPIGHPPRQKRTLRALGLRRVHQAVKQDDTPATRGMIDRVRHLVTVEEMDRDTA